MSRADVEVAAAHDVDDGDDGIMVLRVGVGEIDPASSLTCEERSGDDL